VEHWQGLMLGLLFVFIVFIVVCILVFTCFAESAGLARRGNWERKKPGWWAGLRGEE
jgi:hypothetical protein